MNLVDPMGTRRFGPAAMALALAVILLLHALLLWNSVAQESASVDELSHLATGVYSLTTLDFRLNRATAPMQNLVEALPVVCLADVHLTFDHANWREGIWNGVGDRFLEANPQSFHHLLMLGRAGAIVLTEIFNLVVFLLARRCWGLGPAGLVLAFTLFEPNFMAHGRLATTDVAPSLFFLYCGYRLWRFSASPSWRNALLVGVAFGLSWYSKHAGLVIVPAVLLALLGLGAFSPAIFQNLFAPSRFRRIRERVRFVAHAMVLTLFIAVSGFLVLWACYGFEVGDSIQEPRNPNRSYVWHELQFPLQTLIYAFNLEDRFHFDGMNPEEPFWRFLQTWLPAFSHWEGLFSTQDRIKAGHLGYLMGRLSFHGWKSYYPILFLIKTPIPTLIVFLFGALLLVQKKVCLEVGSQMAFWCIPAILAFTVIFYNTANIGYRHALPIIPFFLLLLVGAVGKWTVQQGQGFRIRWCEMRTAGVFYLDRRLVSSALGLVVVGSLLIWNIVSVLRIHPHYLEYFNEFTGGPQYGHLYAVDSNLDWGQDLLFLKDYLARRPELKVHLLYFGPTKLPDAYGVPHLPSRPMNTSEPGDYVVSATLLHGIGAGSLTPQLAPFLAREPDEYITYALFLYHVP